MRTPTYELRIAASCSMGRPAYNHDIRHTHTDNVNTDLSKDNVVLIDELKGRPVDEYLDELLQPAIDEYNEKQKRKDRKINMSYTEWHKLNDNKGEMVYEFVMQYGEHEDLGQKYFWGSQEDKQKLRDQFKELYTKWLKDWQDQHPNQKVLWATIHFDETGGTPHMHLAVCPLSQDFKKGPKTQISMSKSLESDGFKRLDTKKEGYQLARAFEKFRETQEADLRQLGYEIKERKGGKHLDCDQYKEVMTAATQAAQQITEEAQKKVEAIDLLQSELEEIDRIERLPSYDPTKVKHVQVKTGFMKSEEMVQMPVDVFESLREGIDSRSLNRDTEEKVKRQKETFSKVIKASMTPKEEALQRKVTDLKAQLEDKTKKLEQAETVIKQKTRLIEKLESIIESVKDFLRDRGLLRTFEQSQERNDRTR